MFTLKQVCQTVLSVVGLVMALWAQSVMAQAQPEDERSDSPKLRLALSGHYLFYPQGDCRQEMDVHLCTVPGLTLGAQVGAHYFFSSNRFAFGILGSGDWSVDNSVSHDDGPHDEERMTVWRGALETLFYPYSPRRVNLWLGLEAGVMGAIDTHQVVSNGEVKYVKRDQAIAPSLGGGIGLDIHIIGGLFVGFEWRALLALFTPDDSMSRYATENLKPGIWMYNGMLSIGYLAR